jgi:hypothetical protein
VEKKSFFYGYIWSSPVFSVFHQPKQVSLSCAQTSSFSKINLCAFDKSRGNPIKLTGSPSQYSHFPSSCSACRRWRRCDWGRCWNRPRRWTQSDRRRRGLGRGRRHDSHQGLLRQGIPLLMDTLLSDRSSWGSAWLCANLLNDSCEGIVSEIDIILLIQLGGGALRFVRGTAEPYLLNEQGWGKN